MSELNPFEALLDQSSTEPPINKIKSKHKSITTILEIIFGFTLNENHSNHDLLYLNEVANTFKRQDMDLQIIQHVLFDRLFLCNDDDLKVQHLKTFSHSHEISVIKYLYNCYINVKNNNDLSLDEKTKLNELIIQNSSTAFINSEIYQQDLDIQLIDILKDQLSYYDDYFKDLCKFIRKDDDGGDECMKEKLTSLINKVTEQIIKSYLTTFDYNMLNVFRIFTTDEYLADIFLDVKPAKFSVGFDYANTPLGALFNISALPKTANGTYEHFQNPFNPASNANTETLVWENLDKFIELLHTLILNLLTCSKEIKNKTLQWLGNCINANEDRRKLWNSQAPPEFNPANYTNVTDGFMINFGHVMIRFCQPFCSDFKDLKVLKVDPTYCRVPNDKVNEKSIHLTNLASETCLIPVDSNGELQEDILLADKYNFITDCFFMAHKALNIGYQVTLDKFFQLNNEVGRMERAYNDAVQQANGNQDYIDSLKQRVTQKLTKYLSIKSQLCQPVLLNLFFDFITSTCYWLNQVSLHTNFNGNETFAPLTEIPLTFPLTEQIPNTLKCIPEFVIENIVSYLRFVRRFQPRIFEEKGFDKMTPIMSFILIYMGSPERMKNPHLRATLAEGLDSLVPHIDDESNSLISCGIFQRKLLFTDYEHSNQIVRCLLTVFVGIEMTGQSVEFEQKFNYRRPMYAVMNYLWDIDEHRNCFKLLAEEAEKNMEAVTPPLFLRFVNLLMNDAVYLLDEALSNMAKLREMQRAKDSGEWDSLSAQERTQNLSYMHYVGMIAKFDNMLGKDTIETLEKLTSIITIVFTHSTMVERVAAMLNYFLLNLVGPNKKNFKVKDQQEYKFNPADTVLNICKIYVNLKNNEQFCLAISQDGRSYSSQLFQLAEDVLVRIGGGLLIGELKELAIKVEKKSKENCANEELIAEAPEHFLDPIMSTLMIDPVILPSSKQTVDRTTIARHLLSDQTDPFNRAPLSMDQIVPNLELAEEIRKWLEEHTGKNTT